MTDDDRLALRHLWRSVRPFRGFGLFTVLLVVVVFVAWPVGQALFGWALNDVAAGRAVQVSDDGIDASLLWWWIGVFAAYAVGRILVLYAAQVCRLRFGAQVLRHLRDRLYTQVLRLDQGYHRLHGSGELIARTTRDGDKVREALYRDANDLLETGVMIVASVGLLTWYSPLLASLPALLLLGVSPLLLRQAGRLTLLNRDADHSYDRLTQDLTEGVEGVRVIKAFSLEPARIARFDRHVDAFSAKSLRAVLFSAVHFSVPQAVFALGHGWVLVMGAWLVAEGTLQIGDLVAALMAMTTCIFRLDSLGNAVRHLADARASMQRLAEVLEAEPAFSGGTQPLPAGPLGIRCRDLGVRAEDDEQGGVRSVLAGLDLDIAAGESVALVGPTGSGKSTLAQLLPRLEDPATGTIELCDTAGAGMDVRRLELGALRRAVQVAFQETFLFSATVAENLRVAAPAASDEQLWEALRVADLADFVADVGLHARMGERGLTLSGGQKQRLGLARALLAEPRILVLDDSTSALDAVTERRVLERLRQRVAGITLVLIASRATTAQLADRVLVLDDGRVSAQGAHQELRRSSALYRELMGLSAEGAA